jgi:hypothetical protein
MLIIITIVLTVFILFNLFVVARKIRRCKKISNFEEKKKEVDILLITNINWFKYSSIFILYFMLMDFFLQVSNVYDIIMNAGGLEWHYFFKTREVMIFRVIVVSVSLFAIILYFLFFTIIKLHLIRKK